MENNYTVYIHIFPNKKVYIGITQQKPQKRWDGGNGYYKQDLIYNAIQKYGWKNIEHKILFTNLTKEEAEQKEIELISKYKSNNRDYGYNITNGGNVVGTLTEEIKKKISESHKGKPRPQYVIEKLRQANLGKIISKETRKKQSETMKKKNLYGKSNPFYGYKHSEETKKHWSKIRKGRKFGPISEERRKKISIANKGRVAHNKGIPMSKEQKIKLGKPIICLDTGVVYYSLKEAENQTGISYQTISCCVKKKTKTAGGYHWEFINKEQN